MDQLWRAFSILAFACVLGGCSISPSPEYPVDRLRFDAALLGRWEVVGEHEDAPAVQMVIKAREVDLLNNRVDPHAFRMNGRPASARTMAYQIILVAEQDTPAIEWDAFLFEAAGRRFLGMQVSEKQLAESGLLGVVAPMHHVTRVSMPGEDLHLQWPRVMVAWMPNSGWVDADPDARLPFDWRARKHGAEAKAAHTSKPMSVPGVWLTNDVDRLIDVYETVAAEEEFWEEAEVYLRVAE